MEMVKLSHSRSQLSRSPRLGGGNLVSYLICFVLFCCANSCIVRLAICLFEKDVFEMGNSGPCISISILRYSCQFLGGKTAKTLIGFALKL